MKRGQVWLETVIYTLVGLALIGLVLGIVTPQINEYRDRAVIEQTITALNDIDTIITGISTDIGNARVLEFRIKKGSLIVSSVNDSISFILEESKVLYSEPGVATEVGRIRVLTEETGTKKTVTLSLDYVNRSDIRISSGELEKKFTSAPVPYKFRFENLGVNASAPVPLGIVDFREISGG